jgi:3-phenylpropionate/cinnamic acid dioxygenase small subunit
VRAPSSENNEGLLLSTFTLVRIGQAQRAAADPAKRDLLAKKEELEQKIDKLKYEKAAMPEDEYKSQLTSALVELAHVQQELDK